MTSLGDLTTEYNSFDLTSSLRILVDMKILHSKNVFCLLDQANYKVLMFNYLNNTSYFEQDIDDDYGTLQTLSISGDDNFIAITSTSKKEIKLLKSSLKTSTIESSDSSKPIDSSETETESETINSLGIHAPSGNVDYFSNPITTYAVQIAVIGSYLGFTMSAASASNCPNFGVALIKMIQLVEILGKFLYIPVIYQGWLLDGLSGINDIGDAVALPEDIFI